MTRRQYFQGASSKVLPVALATLSVVFCIGCCIDSHLPVNHAATIFQSHDEIFPTTTTTTTVQQQQEQQQQQQQQQQDQEQQHKRRLTQQQMDPKTVVQKNNAFDYPYHSLTSNVPVYTPAAAGAAGAPTVVGQYQRPQELTRSQQQLPSFSTQQQQFPSQQQQQFPSQQQQQHPQQAIIYTFWAPVTPLPNGDKGTGMTDEADDHMLALWKQAWEAIGWQPRVLTLQDAQRHPRFDEFYEKLQTVPLWGNRRQGVNREYNQWCYIRWLAMAAVGGGWMSDYDVLPIRRIHHHLGAFTAHEARVPSLVSGSQEEWARMAWAVLENGVAHNQPEVNLWSDMDALANLQDQQSQPQYHYIVNQTVTEAGPLLTGKPWTKNKECDMLKRHDAIHFSHNSIQMGVLREGEKFRDRPRVAARIMKLYYAKCANI
eukprot:CAMPEP_0119004314 /NCGR_PEP_ID=MMETSP1176-20130426/1074_1 /TAXON_ID=265551 /ORGANISM="Synedropsis recta cf, Strain CCMP1620" /LENGTH=428 /DNA_ID=CAMNT_0006956005 /DNA_START=9 /DNA_END=1295 /DNA_ORIENTATION=+